MTYVCICFHEFGSTTFLRTESVHDPEWGGPRDSDTLFRRTGNLMDTFTRISRSADSSKRLKVYMDVCE